MARRIEVVLPQKMSNSAWWRARGAWFGTVPWAATVTSTQAQKTTMVPETFIAVTQVGLVKIYDKLWNIRCLFVNCGFAKVTGDERKRIDLWTRTGYDAVPTDAFTGFLAY